MWMWKLIWRAVAGDAESVDGARSRICQRPHGQKFDKTAYQLVTWLSLPASGRAIGKIPGSRSRDDEVIIGRVKDMAGALANV